MAHVEGSGAAAATQGAVTAEGAPAASDRAAAHHSTRLGVSPSIVCSAGAWKRRGAAGGGLEGGLGVLECVCRGACVCARLRLDRLRAVKSVLLRAFGSRLHLCAR